MHIRDHAELHPDRPAIIMASTGEQVTFAELEASSNRGAQLLRRLGLRRGDVFALWSANNARYLEIVWAMQRTGLYMVPVQARLTADEAAYVIDDSGARVLIIDGSMGPASQELADRWRYLCPKVEHCFSLRANLEGLERWEDAAGAMPARSVDDQSQGMAMIYSSGTTGRPKGVVHPLPETPFDAPPPHAFFHRDWLRVEAGTSWVVTSPLHHSGPLNLTLAEHWLGSTVVIFEKFDPETVLAGIERYRAARGQFVPTMFARMVKLPAETRARYDLSSLRAVVHSGGPCPVEVKRRLIAWWGPVVYEMYGSTESAGVTVIDSHEWLRKPGSVGKPLHSAIHVCAEDGSELGAGETGLIYFDGNAPFKYRNDPAKTAAARHPDHSDWATQGDIGHLDHDGYLYLTDRQSFMIISGGVNIYPQEVENALVMHPDVADIAVFGVPDDDMGERVMALVQPADWSRAGPELAGEIAAFCKAKLASYKCPRTIEFERSLPRDALGKMMKGELRDRYRGDGH